MALIALGVTGGIGAYKAVEVARGLQKRGHEVVAVMTHSATRFVGPVTFEAITRRQVITDQFEGGMNAEIEHIGRGLLDCSLPKIEWTHAAHFAAAFWLLRCSEADAARDMPRLIRAYNVATGVPNSYSSGYHETITLGSLRAARAWLLARPGAAAHEALMELLRSEYGRSDWLLS